MLESSILQQVTEIFRNLEADYTFRISQSPLREESSQLIEFLNDFASTLPLPDSPIIAINSPASTEKLILLRAST